MHYKLSPRDEIYNRKHKINKNTVNNEGSQLCLLLIGVYIYVSIISTILIHLYIIYNYLYY